MTAPATPALDPDAPYGRYERGSKRGQPRPRPARPGGGRLAGMGRSSRPDPTPAPRSRPARRPTATPQAGTSKVLDKRAESAAGALQLVGFAAQFVPDRTGVIPLDVAAVGLHTPALARGLARTSVKVPWLALALDRLAIVGPYTEAITAGTALVAQLLVNHGIMPIEAMRKAGAVSRERLQAWLLQQAREKAEEDRALLDAEAEAFQELQRAAAAGVPAGGWGDVEDQGDDAGAAAADPAA